MPEPGAGDDEPVYTMAVAARLTGMHPQTLRKYERLGLVQPTRTVGSMRLYTREELERLRIIKRLVDDGGINLAGVQRLMFLGSSCIYPKLAPQPIKEEYLLTGLLGGLHCAAM